MIWLAPIRSLDQVAVINSFHALAGTYAGNDLARTCFHLLSTATLGLPILSMSNDLSQFSGSPHFIRFLAILEDLSQERNTEMLETPDVSEVQMTPQPHDTPGP